MSLLPWLAITSFLLGPSIASAQSSVFLCGGAQVVQADVVTQDGKATLVERWHWRPEESRGMPEKLMRKFITTDDCKPVDSGHKLLITSSGDAVALVAYPSGDTLFSAVVKNAHSAELLPHGLVAVASSDSPDKEGDRLLLFMGDQSSKPIGYLPLEAAHGAVWDAKRNVLWALGGKTLLKIALETTGPIPHFVVERAVDLPEPIGHDLQIAADDSMLYLATTKRVLQVDPEHMTFAPFEPFRGISGVKSLSINAQTKQIAFTEADPGVWWTYTLRFLGPQDTVKLPSMIYKVRWTRPAISVAAKSR